MISISVVRVMPRKIEWSTWRVMIVPASSMIQAFEAAPSLIRPSASMSQAS